MPARCCSRRGPWRSGPSILLATVLAATVVWLVILPNLARRPQWQQRLERRHRLGINAGAMFYTELTAMPRILRRIDHLRRLDRRRHDIPDPST